MGVRQDQSRFYRLFSSSKIFQGIFPWKRATHGHRVAPAVPFLGEHFTSPPGALTGGIATASWACPGRPGRSRMRLRNCWNLEPGLGVSEAPWPRGFSHRQGPRTKARRPHTRGRGLLQSGKLAASGSSDKAAEMEPLPSCSPGN